MAVLYRYTGTEWDPVGAPSGSSVRYGVLVTASATQNLSTSTWVAVGWDQETYDDDAMHDSSTNNSRLTCKTAGTYLIEGMVGVSINSTNMRIAGFRLNGTGSNQPNRGLSGVMALNGTHTPIALSATLTLALNDYVEMMVYQDSGGTRTTEWLDNAHFSMHRIA